MDPMAISSYLGWFLALLFGYPFVLVGLQFAVYEEQKRQRVTFWFNVAFVVVILVVLTYHMQTEVVYGQSLLEAWYTLHPEDRPK
ncbi:hypothetical protein HC752_09425 [Vibrio sp. S9_S30]|nr:hypothetical protein [Vibrio sp. S9_S30]